MLEDRKIKLLGHIMRGSTEDPLYKVTFDDEGNRMLHTNKRVGRPRNHWTKFTMCRAYERLYEDDWNADDDNCRIMLFTAAIERLF